MTGCENEKTVVSLKQAIWEGIILDLLLFLISGTIMDGGHIASIMLFVVIAHWILNAAVLFSKQAKHSKAGKDFIRFGIFPLMLVTFVVRGILIFLGVSFL